LQKLNLEERRASYAVGMFDATKIGKGFGTEATQLVCEYAFSELNLHRIYLRVAQYNCQAPVFRSSFKVSRLMVLERV